MKNTSLQNIVLATGIFLSVSVPLITCQKVNDSEELINPHSQIYLLTNDIYSLSNTNDYQATNYTNNTYLPNRQERTLKALKYSEELNKKQAK